MYTVLVDADILSYSVGFSTQKTWYTVEDKDTGFGYEFGTKREALEIGTDITVRVDSLDEEAASKKLHEAVSNIKKNTKCREVKLLLTGKGNFRDTIAVSFPYKGNRKADKPVHYQFLRDLMVSYYGAEIIEGEEADDALGYMQNDNTIIASIDKDLMMIEGKHYNIMTGKKTLATDPGKLKLTKTKLEGFGFKWFCTQMILGDPTDNIKGIPGLGNVKTFKIFKDIKDPIVMWETVERIYCEKDMIHRIEENALLLWIRREKGQHPFDFIGELYKEN